MILTFPPDKLDTEQAYHHVAAIKDGNLAMVRKDFLNLSEELTEVAAILYQRTCIYLETPIEKPHILDKTIQNIRAENKPRLEFALGRATLRYTKATYEEIIKNLYHALQNERLAINYLEMINIERESSTSSGTASSCTIS
uniref:MIT domain-containing protein n=1 Tax=Caenorhabditis tropicalis TaxID=1561998 RepID=A0A1I7US54_9PELO